MEHLKKMLENIGPKYRCDVRWWLAEGLHTDETLKREIGMLQEDGFGAAEFLAIDELGADSTRYGWGSEEFVHDTQLIIEETTKRGLGASLTSGTNWSNANLPDFVHMPDDPSASKELDYTVEELAPGQARNGPLQKAVLTRAGVQKQELIAVVAAKKVGEQGGKPVLSANTLVLTDKVENGALEWTAPGDGNYLLFALWMHGSGQTASPSVSVSYTVNYIDRYGIDKLTEYWDREVLTPALRANIKKNGHVQMYMDSLELSTYGQGGQFWGYTLLDEFKARRGYCLTPYLPFILRRITGMSFGPYDYRYLMEDSLLAARIQCDLYQTMTELYTENMLKPMQAWLHTVGMTLRAEISYGLPFEISLPGKYVDGIETESLEFGSQIDSFRGLAGVANLYGKVYSSETGATRLNYMLNMDFFTQVIYTQFAAGISRTVLHGYSSICGAEETTRWPGHEGMWPIFSERFGERQPAYKHYRDWTAMIARYQRLLRSGKPRRDVAILRLDYNFWNTLARWKEGEKTLYESKLMRANEGIYWKDCTMQNAGYTYDYFAPQLLEDEDVKFADGMIQPDGPGYRAVLLYQEMLPLGSAKKLLELANKGLPIIFANGLTETIQQDTDAHHPKACVRTPFNDGKDGELAAVITGLKALPNVREIDDPAQVVRVLAELGVTPRAGLVEPSDKVFTLLREDGDWKYAYVYNYMYPVEGDAKVTLKLEGTGKPYRVDCWTGDVREQAVFRTESGYTLIDITLRPGEAAMYALDTAQAAGLHAVGTDACGMLLCDGVLTAISRNSGKCTTTISDGQGVRSVETDFACRDDIPLDDWSLVVEGWDEGEKRVVEEDRGLGYVTREVYYETKKTNIEVGPTALKPWKDIPAVGPKVSGVGTYTTTLTLPVDWGDDDIGVLCIGSTNGSTAVVYVNGQKGPAVDFDSLRVDITKLLQPGENTLVVEVTSTLTNRLLARNYYQETQAITDKVRVIAMGHDDDGEEIMLKVPDYIPVQDYGMVGEVKLATYKKAKLN